jgi:hypothetical protein
MDLQLLGDRLRCFLAAWLRVGFGVEGSESGEVEQEPCVNGVGGVPFKQL